MSPWQIREALSLCLGLVLSPWNRTQILPLHRVSAGSRSVCGGWASACPPGVAHRHPRGAPCSVQPRVLDKKDRRHRHGKRQVSVWTRPDGPGRAADTKPLTAPLLQRLASVRLGMEMTSRPCAVRDCADRPPEQQGLPTSLVSSARAQVPSLRCLLLLGSKPHLILALKYIPIHVPVLK